MPETEKTSNQYHTKSKSNPKTPYYSADDGNFIRGNEKVEGVYISFKDAVEIVNHFNKQTKGVTDEGKRKQFALKLINIAKANQKIVLPCSQVGGSILFYQKIKISEGKYQDGLYHTSVVDKISPGKAPVIEQRQPEDSGLGDILSDSKLGDLSDLGDLADKLKDSGAPIPLAPQGPKNSLVEQAYQGTPTLHNNQEVKKQSYQASEETMKRYGSKPEEKKSILSKLKFWKKE
jgi:hypothetical protein